MIRDYHPSDEPAWLRCRVLSFLGSNYYDDVKTSTTVFEHPAIRLVSEHDGLLDALLDIEIFGPGADGCRTATIDCLAVHPDRQRTGLASALLTKGLERLPGDVVHLDAWTREDRAANAWYQAQGFVENDSYLHVYKGYDESADGFSAPPGLRGPIVAFLHADRAHEEWVRARFAKVYICRQYLRRLTDEGPSADPGPTVL